MCASGNQESVGTRFHLWLAILALVASLASCSKHAEPASASVVQRTFASPAGAGTALFEAARCGDPNMLMAIFGAEGKDLVLSGDTVKDKNQMQRFVDAYSQMNRWSMRKSGDAVLYVGADNFAFPVPLAKTPSGEWAFNAAAGKDEVLARRIGDGELTTIGLLTEIVNAQREYFGQTHQFARKFVSDDNQHDGLYWPVAEGQLSSPLGRLAEEAKAMGYSQSDNPQPFNG